jgi:glucokinase
MELIMHVIGIDLGGTKLAAAIFDKNGKILQQKNASIGEKSGRQVEDLVVQLINHLLKFADENKIQILSIGISVPGIYYADSGNVWAPNIKGWDNYPLLDELSSLPLLSGINIKIDSDRSCYILGETWQGLAKGSKNAIFLAIGTGIGAGILIDGKILRGVGDVAGAIGWVGLEKQFDEKYKSCGFFEYYASGDGIARSAIELLAADKNYTGILSKMHSDKITSYSVFEAYKSNDLIAVKVFANAVKLWGMTIANLVSIFNPEKIILGGGVFGPAAQFLDQIKEEANKWAQPFSIKQVEILVSSIGSEAGLIGAGKLAFLKE